MSEENISAGMNRLEPGDIRQKIIDFYNSPEFCRLAEYYTRKNLFDILGVARKELIHSRMLKWILDPDETHCLGQYPLKKFLQTVAYAKTSYKGNRESSLSADLIDAFITESYSLSEADIYLEKTVPSHSGKKKDRRLDLVAKVKLQLQGEMASKDIQIILENKVDTDEHSEQTKDYHDWAVNEFKASQPVFVFLTPCSMRELDSETNGCSSRDFIHVNYQLLSEMVFGPCLERMSDSPAKTLLSDYLRCLSIPAISEDNDSFDKDTQHHVNKPNQGRTIMAIPEEERKLLMQFWKKNRNLLLTALEVVADDRNVSDEERKLIEDAGKSISRSTTTYSFDGKDGFPRGKLVCAVVEKWVRDHNPQSFDEVLKAFPAEAIKKNDRNDKEYGIVRPDNWEEFEKKPDLKDPKRRDFIDLSITGDDKMKIWVRTWWLSDPFTQFLQFMKEKHPEYKIEADD